MMKWLASVFKNFLWDLGDVLFITLISLIVVIILFLILGGIAVLLM